MEWFVLISVHYVVLKHFNLSLTVFEKINDFLVNTVLGQVSVIAWYVFSEKQVIQWKKCLFYCISVNCVVLKQFNVNFIDSIWENQWFFIKHCFRPS